MLAIYTSCCITVVTGSQVTCSNFVKAGHMFCIHTGNWSVMEDFPCRSEKEPHLTEMHICGIAAMREVHAHVGGNDTAGWMVFSYCKCSNSWSIYMIISGTVYLIDFWNQLTIRLVLCPSVLKLCPSKFNCHHNYNSVEILLVFCYSVIG